MSGRTDYTYNVDVNKLDAERNLMKLSSTGQVAFDKLSNESKIFGSNLSRSSNQSMQLIGSLSKLGAVGGIAAAAYGLKSYADTATETYGEFEKLKVVLANTLQSSVKADDSFAMIQKFAAKTPFQVDELTDSFVKLANRGFIPTSKEMTSLGDLASATGKNFDQLTEAILDAETFEFERLKEFGIKASQSGDKVKLTFKGQTQEIDKNAAAVRNAILQYGKMKGVAGGMAAISNTLSGSNSNLEDSYTNLEYVVGSRLAPAYISFNKVQKRIIDGLADMLRFDPAEQFLGQASEATILVEKLSNVNTSEEERLRIYEELLKKHPAIVEGIKAESLELDKLQKNLKEYTQDKIIAAQLIPYQEDIEKQADVVAEYVRLKRERIKGFGDQFADVLADAPKEQKVKAYSLFQEQGMDAAYRYARDSVDAGFLDIGELHAQYKGITTFGNARADAQQKLDKMLDDFEELKKTLGIEESEQNNDEQKKTPTEEIVSGDTTNNLSKVSAGISSGGSRPTIINVTLGQFQEKMEVNIHQGEFAEKVGMIEEQFQEMFLRVLNSSAQVANQ